MKCWHEMFARESHAVVNRLYLKVSTFVIKLLVVGDYHLQEENYDYSNFSTIPSSLLLLVSDFCDIVSGELAILSRFQKIQIRKQLMHNKEWVLNVIKKSKQALYFNMGPKQN